MITYNKNGEPELNEYVRSIRDIEYIMGSLNDEFMELHDREKKITNKFNELKQYTEGLEELLDKHEINYEYQNIDIL